MNNTAVKLLEYDRVKERLEEYALSPLGKELVRKLEPSTDIQIIKNWLKETSEARSIADRDSSIPVHSLSGIEKIICKFGKGGILQPEELTGVLKLLEGGRKLKRFMEGKRDIAPLVSSYAGSMYDLADLAEELDRCIRDCRIDDKASPELSRVRKKITILEERITSKLESMLRSSAYRDYFQDTLVSVRNGRYVIPVKREYKRNIEGYVLDTSTSGSTVFIEPAAVKRLQDELNLMKIEEDKEEYRILSHLSGMVDSYQRELSINIETMAHYDFIFAKAKYSKAINGSTAVLNTRNYINIKGGKHPLIGPGCIPLDFEIGSDYRTLVITGPNTGGKTVALKTVGIMTMMIQSGMHVPAEKGSEFAVFRDILVDIGDGQSIEQSLSTFSSHIRNIISIMECADPYTLVIIDELGTGTDPGEGMGLAVAVLEDIYKKGSTTLATTHYSEIKEFADNNPGFENGCMEFDINTLKPLYRLRIGKSGESNALLIALRLGMDKSIIERAHEVTYKEKKEYSREIPCSDTAQPVKNIEVVETHARQVAASKQVQETRERIEKQKVHQSFKIGDCVYVSTMKRTGIVCEQENNKGELGVMVMKKRFKVNKKRLSLYVDGKELYPEDYDFDIIFESKDNRKKRHDMGRKHVEGLVVEVSGRDR